MIRLLSSRPSLLQRSAGRGSAAARRTVGSRRGAPYTPAPAPGGQESEEWTHGQEWTRVAVVGTAAVTLIATSNKKKESETANCSAAKPANTNNELSRIAIPIKDITQVYAIGEVLGEGGFGQVYRATRRSNGREVALKRIPKEWTKSDEFQREVNALCKLNDVAGGHQHICQMYDVFEDDDEYWLSMELIEGGEVFEHLIERGAYSEAMAATFLRQFAEALAFMHSAGVVQ